MSDPLKYICPVCLSGPSDACSPLTEGDTALPHRERSALATTKELADDIMAHPEPKRGDHYRRNGIEALDVFEAFDLDRHMTAVVKYALRVGKKTEGRLEDLEKLRDYAQRAVDEECRRRGVEPPVRFDVPDVGTPALEDLILPACSCGFTPRWETWGVPGSHFRVVCPCGKVSGRGPDKATALKDWERVR